jgi:hypothetical protein
VEYEIVWSGDPEDLLVTTEGTATAEGLTACVREVIADPRFRKGMRVLADHRELDWSRLTLEEIHAHVDALAADADRIGRSFCAMVMGKPVDFGIARMTEQYAAANRDFRAELKVFASIEHARQWLSTLPAPVRDANAY